jgi:hypothetical protein
MHQSHNISESNQCAVLTVKRLRLSLPRRMRTGA